MSNSLPLVPVFKASSDITDEELEQMHVIYKAANENMPPDHIRNNHIRKSAPTFILFKEGDAVLAYHAYSFHRLVTPFRKRALPLFLIHLAYRRSDADRQTKNFAYEANKAMLQKELGWRWWASPFAMVLETYNPKLYSRVHRWFPRVYPNGQFRTTAEVMAFMRRFFHEKMGYRDVVLNDRMVKQAAYAEPTDVTRDWERNYRAGNSAFNDFFHQEKVLLQEDDKYLLTGASAFLLGYYSLPGLLRKRMGW